MEKARGNNFMKPKNETVFLVELKLERVARIELALSAWKAGVIPLYDTRVGRIVTDWAGLSNHGVWRFPVFHSSIRASTTGSSWPVCSKIFRWRR